MRLLVPALALLVSVTVLGCTGPEEKASASAVAAPTQNAGRSYLVPGHAILGGARSGAKPMMPPMPGHDGPNPHQGMAPDADEVTLVWDKPAGWAEVPASAMRKASYKVAPVPPDTEGGDASVSSAGGDIEANINRWIGQFEEKPKPKRQEILVAGYKVTLIELEGTFKGGMMPGGEPADPKPNTRLLGAIVEVPGEPYFFKLTGPKVTITAARKDFDAWVSSVHKAK